MIKQELKEQTHLEHLRAIGSQYQINRNEKDYKFA
jgi:hypothetical protein